MSKQLRGGYNVIFMNKKRYVEHVNVEAKKKKTHHKKSMFVSHLMKIQFENKTNCHFFHGQ